MNEDITYCLNSKCKIMSCPRNSKHIQNHNIPHSLAHLEDNPLYCKKPNWHGNQVKEENDD